MVYINKSNHHMAIELNRNSRYIILYDEDTKKSFEITRLDLRRNYWCYKNAEKVPYWFYVKHVMNTNKIRNG